MKAQKGKTGIGLLFL